jgi:hypothetical protein
MRPVATPEAPAAVFLTAAVLCRSALVVDRPGVLE